MEEAAVGASTTESIIIGESIGLIVLVVEEGVRGIGVSRGAAEETLDGVGAIGARGSIT